MSKTSNDRNPSTLITEVYFFRFVCCISVVFIHSISIAFNQYSFDPEEFWGLRKIQMVFMFATPAFIWISQLILGFSYRNRKPKRFWVKRWKYLIVPYLVVGLLTAVLPYTRDISNFEWSTFMERLLRIYFLGEWIGYFVLIILQFYLLYFILHKYLDRWPVWLVITIGFVVNFVYLYHIHFGDRIPFLQSIDFYKHSKIPFLGWVFYFLVGYYCGRYFERFVQALHRFRYLIWSGGLISLIIILSLIESRVFTSISSKRMDILIYTICVVFTLFYIANRMKKIPMFVYMISQASYGIYLIHPTVQSFLLHQFFLSKYTVNPGLYITIQFGLGVIVSFAIVYLLNQWKYGSYLIGKIRYLESPREKEKSMVFSHRSS